MKTVATPKGEKSDPRPKSPPSNPPKTGLGKRLSDLRQKYIAEGGKLLDWAALEREVAERKGRIN